MANKVNKYLYYYVLQGNYGSYGFEDLCAGTWREVRDNRKDYRENEPGTPLRVIHRRERNPEFSLDSALSL